MSGRGRSCYFFLLRLLGRWWLLGISLKFFRWLRVTFIFHLIFLLRGASWITCSQCVYWLLGLCPYHGFSSFFLTTQLASFLILLCLSLSLYIRICVEVIYNSCVFFFNFRFNLVNFILYCLYRPIRIAWFVLFFDYNTSFLYLFLFQKKEFLYLSPGLITKDGHGYFEILKLLGSPPSHSIMWILR